MTSKSQHALLGRLHDIREGVLLLLNDEARREAINDIDDTVRLLQELRVALDSVGVDDGSLIRAIDNLLSFLVRASEDKRLGIVLRRTKARKLARPPKPKRQPIRIKENLTNDEVRELLRQTLSRAELEAIAKQKGISVGKRNINQLRDAVLGFVDKQDSYAKLGS